MVGEPDPDTFWITFMSRQSERILSYTQKEVVGKNDSDIFPEEEAQARMAMDLAILQSGQLADIVEEHVLTRQPQYLLGISEDITEYRRAREALQESEDRFKSFMEHTPALAWLKDEAWTLRVCKPHVARASWARIGRMAPSHRRHNPSPRFRPPMPRRRCGRALLRQAIRRIGLYPPLSSRRLFSQGLR